MKLAIHDQHGRISQICFAPNASGMDAITPPGYAYCEVGDDVGDTTHFIVAGKALAIPERPSKDHVFDYPSKSWIDPRTIEQLRNAKWVEIKKARDAAEFGGFTWAGHVFDSNQLAVQRISTAFQAALLARASVTLFVREWTLKDNSTVILDAEGMVGVYAALEAHVNAVHARAQGLRQVIAVATSRGELDAIVW